jgi:hypothetical protein
MNDPYTYMPEMINQKIQEMQEAARQIALAKEANQDNFSLRKYIGNSLISFGEKIAGEPKQIVANN